jgi:hypothetical protein
MKFTKLLFVLLLAVILLTACNLKVNINSNANQLPEVGININANTNAAPTDKVAIIEVVPEVVTNSEGMIVQVKNATNNEVLVNNIKELCGQEMMLFAQPKAAALVETLIVRPFNPGSDQPVKELYVLNISAKTCNKLEISKELSDFGARVLSPDQTKLAVALETNEAKILTLVDLFKDTSKILVTLPEDETLNGGYGALSNHFDIKWLDDKTIQYTVYKDTVKNYDINAPSQIEDVLQVRVVKIE